MNRKQRRALGRGGGNALSRAGGGGNIATLFNAAIEQHRAGALADAERRYREILALAPKHAHAHSRLGALLMSQGRTAEAISYLQHAVALDPTLFEAQGNLAQAYMVAGQTEAAIVALSRAIEISETPQVRALFVQWIPIVRFRGNVDAGVKRLVLRALVEGWARPRDLTVACIALIKCSSAVTDCIRRALAAWPVRPAGAELFGTEGLASLAADHLLCRLLESDPIPDVGLERLLAGVRATMLDAALGLDSNVDAQTLEFFSAVTRQCFINEYVYSLDAHEEDQANELRLALVERIETGAEIPPLWPVAIGAYVPLGAVAGTERLPERSWPQPVEAVIRQQVVEPAEERRIAATIPALTAIDDEVSRAVRRQYEENPYPRWSEPTSRRVARYDTPARNAPGEVLIAGCGTGLSSIDFARQAPNSRILSVDLSLASLSYAKRMAQSLGLGNVEFAHADILNLGAIERVFDLIDASGVLHHLADPWAGWRALLSLLRAGGTMHVGLYSELGRRNIVAGRGLIAERGYRPVAGDIRRCREDIISSPDPLLRSLTESIDFFTVSECRDLLFHVQEHRIALPEIKTFLAANSLDFGGFLLDQAILQKFALRYPDRGALADLDRWHEFEVAQPDTFAGMYQFRVVKAPAQIRLARPRAQ